jgi:hypothetical protein
MLHKNQRLQSKFAVGTLVRSCLALSLIVIFLLFPANALANTGTAAVNGTSPPSLLPTFEVKAGFNAHYRDGNWVPVQITLNNKGADFRGTLSISAPSAFAGLGNSTPSSTYYKESITLASGAQKQVNMYIPLHSGIQGVTQTLKIELLDDNGNIVHTQTSTLTALGPDDVFVGILSDQSSGFNSLSSISLPNQGGSIVVETFNASTMPGAASMLKNFDLIVLDNFTTGNLSNDQLSALQTWIDQGGALIEVGGPEWRRTLSALPASLLPVSINGTSILPAGTSLLPVNGSSNGGTGKGPMVGAGTINAPVTVSTATLAQGDKSYPILASGKIPLIVQALQGQGSICYLAFDPTLAPIINWPAAGTLWRGLVFRSLGDKLLSSSGNIVPGASFQWTRLSELLQNHQPNTLPSPWLLLVLLLCYLIIIGPVRILLVRQPKRRNWNWHIMLSSIIVFSLLTYGLAIHQNGTSIVSNSVSVLRFNEGGSSAHITTYIGIFAPNQGNYQVHIPGEDLVQPALVERFNSGPSPSDAGQQQTTITSGQDGVDVNLQGGNTGLLAVGDQQVHGGISSQLALANGILTGTVTNTLHYSLSDVYVLMPDTFVRIGDLLAGQTKQVYLTLSSSPGNTGTVLADQIAQSYQLPAPYSPIASSASSAPQNELQRRLAILSALGGGGGLPNSACTSGSCSVAASSSSYIVPNGGISSRVNNNDPLLIASSPATLIGWAVRPKDIPTDVTINGSNPPGFQETLVQAGLNVHYSGTVNLPADFLTGHLIDVQGKNVQIRPDGAYIMTTDSMTTDSMTFEFKVPESTELLLNNVTIYMPSNLAQPSSLPGSTTIGDATELQAYLYNWRTGSWDGFSLSGFTFATSNSGAYIGPGGRILLQLANQSNNLTILFGKPTLNL